ncbi:hypothetical protein [Cupriavidus oxalaticus]|uniref:Uncharacterized protein n=1 Tax=Cupriavidus oxalaticus TaxID=96344 RepID=A0A4P7LKP8_9BURK|nr:hypothetical protein [Cupriavidus oxalaticus]QBY56138.1 hypothetical protein E0W60_34330 [Cupriavidus oxalaticus]
MTTRVDVAPPIKRASPGGGRRVLRPRRPLTERELDKVFPRIKKRILKGGEPFGVFAMKRGHGRTFVLLGKSSPEFSVQLRVNEARQHLVAIYDGTTNLGYVWDDLTSFDRPAERSAPAKAS